MLGGTLWNLWRQFSWVDYEYGGTLRIFVLSSFIFILLRVYEFTSTNGALYLGFPTLYMKVHCILSVLWLSKEETLKCLNILLYITNLNMLSFECSPLWIDITFASAALRRIRKFDSRKDVTILLCAISL